MQTHAKHVCRLLLRPKPRYICPLHNVVCSPINMYAIHTIMLLACTIVLCFAYQLIQEILKKLSFARLNVFCSQRSHLLSLIVIKVLHVIEPVHDILVLIKLACSQAQINQMTSRLI